MVVLLGEQPSLFSQPEDTITNKDVSRIIHFLASDSLKGRGNGRPELLKAGLFIGDEFKKSNLLPLPGLPGYFIPFRPFGGSKQIVADYLLWNDKPVPSLQFVFVQHRAGNYSERQLSDFKVIQLDTFFTQDVLKGFAGDSSPLLLWTNKMQPDGKEFFPDKFNTPFNGLQHDVLLVYAETPPVTIVLNGNPSWYSMLEYNIVGLLPGKSKPREVILFSAHYDHEGVFGNRRDSILNGANDNASGTTALLILANYFSKRNDNARTIMFCAFAGEELGLLGSYDFATQINPETIIAAINIEMIGFPGLGKDRVFITGENFSDLPYILGNALRKNRIKVLADPDESMELFKRSDNYPFVLKGIPAHTIMAGTDKDRCYHQPCDEVDRIDIANMTRIIKAIAGSVENLVNGELTPTRIR